MRRTFPWHFNDKGNFEAELEIDVELLAMYLARKVARRLNKNSVSAKTIMANGAIKMKFRKAGS